MEVGGALRFRLEALFSWQPFDQLRTGERLAADYESNESIFYTFFLSIYVRHRIVCIYIFLNGYCK